MTYEKILLTRESVVNRTRLYYHRVETQSRGIDKLIIHRIMFERDNVVGGVAARPYQNKREFVSLEKANQ